MRWETFVVFLMAMAVCFSILNGLRVFRRFGWFSRPTLVMWLVLLVGIPLVVIRGYRTALLVPLEMELSAVMLGVAAGGLVYSLTVIRGRRPQAP